MYLIEERLKNPHYISNYAQIYIFSVTYISNKDGIVEIVIPSRFYKGLSNAHLMVC